MDIIGSHEHALLLQLNLLDWDNFGVQEEGDEDDEGGGRARRRVPHERVIVCTGIPI
jgi:hypothetical protein